MNDAFTSQPVVDLSGLMDPDINQHRLIASIIDEYSKKNGFLYLVNHGVNINLIDSVYQMSKEFFALPTSEKIKYYVGNQRNHRGYVPTTEKGVYTDESGQRRYEAFDMGMELPNDDVDYLSGNPLLGPNIWPTIFGFKSTLGQYYKEMQRVSALMFYAFELILDLPKGYFKQFINKPVSQLRLIHYLENNQILAAEDSNMGAHTDYECFTILHSNQTGLQIMSPENEWLDALPIDNAFYFNIGDILETWSGGRFVSTLHRVKNTGAERYSIPYFAATNYYAKVKPLTNISLNCYQKKYPKIIPGNHIVSQMLRDFPYMMRRFKSGQLNLKGLEYQDNPFERRNLQR